MSPELGFLLFVTLLWGPTALWLLYRAAVSPRNRMPSAIDSRIGAEQSRPAPTATSLDVELFWACESCRSVNRREAKRCYSCRAERGAPPRDATEEPAATPWVPVMAEGISRSRSAAGEPVAAITAATARTPPVRVPILPAAAVLAAAPGSPAPVDAPLPAHAADTGGPVAPPPAVAVAAAAATSVAGVTTFEPTSARPGAAATVPAPASETAPADSGVATVPEVCPFLGLRDDPSTRLDFADSRNVCHASAGPHSGIDHRRSAIGRPRSDKVQAIELDHQATHCLAAAHRACPRYPAIKTVQPSR